jgi:hypothetical protein
LLRLVVVMEELEVLLEMLVVLLRVGTVEVVAGLEIREVRR